MKQKRLPGMEDAKIDELEELADDYMEQRDKRLSYLKKEIELKAKVLDVMHINKKRTYIRGEYVIKVRIEAEKLLVKRRTKKAKA